MSLSTAPTTAALAQMVSGLSQSKRAQHADTLMASARRDAEATPVGQCTPGQQVTLTGVLHWVTLRPQADIQAVEADLYDGTGHIQIVWLGRHRILGLNAGRRIRITGRVCSDRTHPVVFNPRYELLCTPTDR